MPKSSEGLKSAADLSKQIISLSTGVITVTVAFYDKIEGDTPSAAVHWLILGSWLGFVATIGCAVATLQGVTTALDVVDQVDNGEKTAPAGGLPSAWDGKIKVPAMFMIIFFGLALLLAAASAFFRSPPAPSAPPCACAKAPAAKGG